MTLPQVRTLTPEDWPQVAEIYRQGIATGDATFETRVPTWAQWDADRRREPRLVIEVDGRVVGFAVVSPASSREVYAGVAEVMVYVDEAERGRGMGRRLLEALVTATEDAGIWTLQAGIFPENRASIALHEGLGFRVVGVRERLGRFHDGRWRDVVLMERRSRVVGGRWVAEEGGR
ncbi:MAG: N-acetyltransferase family protein [Gemmatimonadetes bacterium]|nr:N-acetyltransferase family protein [Gemmatimonadota bacterium]